MQTDVQTKRGSIVSVNGSSVTVIQYEGKVMTFCDEKALTPNEKDEAIRKAKHRWANNQ